MTEKSPAELVKAIRKAMGLTQEQFAAQFGVTVATVNAGKWTRTSSATRDEESKGMGRQA